MKIPETSANVGAYYGNEENGQWQPNGVIIDSGVGGGVVGSGDAGMHRPPVYPVHLPRGHMPGFVMAGAYYPPTAYPPVPPPVQDDFADYMWMENEEEFDKQVMQQLEEEALMEQCIEAMLEDEQRERHNCPTHNGHNNTHYPTTSNGAQSLSLEETVSRSTLNPLAAEFVPTRARAATSEERQVTSELVVTAETLPKTEESPPEHTAPPEIIENAQMKTEEPLPPQKDPPEVAVVDIPQTDKPERPANKDMKKETTKPPKADIKKPTKTDVKVKAKPLPVKSETKMLLKKKEVKEVKSEVKIEEKPDELPTEAAKVQSAPVPTSAEETQPSSGFKPINYAAAAKANKPKKPIVQQTTDKSQTPATKTVTKEKAKIDKVPAKSEKVLQRKNSAK